MIIDRIQKVHHPDSLGAYVNSMPDGDLLDIRDQIRAEARMRAEAPPQRIPTHRYEPTELGCNRCGLPATNRAHLRLVAGDDP